MQPVQAPLAISSAKGRGPVTASAFLTERRIGFGGGKPGRVGVDTAPCDSAAAKLGHELGSPVQRGQHAVYINALFKAQGSLGFQIQGAARAADRLGRKIGAFNEDVCGRGQNAGVLAAHNAGDGDRAPAVADHQGVVGQLALDFVKG